MSSILVRLKETIDLLSELNHAPAPPAALAKALDTFIRALKAERERIGQETKWRDLMAELANSREQEARKRIEQLSDADFKEFCRVNRIKPGKAKKAKRVKGKIIQKAVAAKKATRTKPAEPAILAKREEDTIIPAITARQATTEIILDEAARLKSQATI